MSSHSLLLISKKREQTNFSQLSNEIWTLPDVTCKRHVWVAVVWFFPSLWQEAYVYKTGLRLVTVYQAAGDKNLSCPILPAAYTMRSWDHLKCTRSKSRLAEWCHVDETDRAPRKLCYCGNLGRRMCQWGHTSNQVVGMMTDKGSLVWVIKKSIGGLKMAASAVCQSWMKEQRRRMD